MTQVNWLVAGPTIVYSNFGPNIEAEGNSSSCLTFSDVDFVNNEKLYFEATTVSSTTLPKSIMMAGITNETGASWGSGAGAIYMYNGGIYGNFTGYGASGIISTPFPCTHGFAVDFGVRKFWARDAIGWKGGDPVTGTNGADFPDGFYRPMISTANGNLRWKGNFGNIIPFSYSVPSGYSAVNPPLSHEVTGVVTIHGSPAQRPVYIYGRDNGALEISGLSDPVTGKFTFPVMNTPKFVVILEDESINRVESRLRDFVIPTEVIN